jgi:hypothetical protein
MLALNQGTIDPALLRLEHKGWISSAWGTSENNRRARFYAITRARKKQLAVEAESWSPSRSCRRCWRASHERHPRVVCASRRCLGAGMKNGLLTKLTPTWICVRPSTDIAVSRPGTLALRAPRSHVVFLVRRRAVLAFAHHDARGDAVIVTSGSRVIVSPDRRVCGCSPTEYLDASSFVVA